MNRLPRYLIPVLAVLLLAGCAGLALKEPLRVTVAGLEPLQGAGLEARFAVLLRIQNPNEQAVKFDGVSLELDIEGREFASGVSDQSGSVPRYGELLVTVPVTVPFTAVVRQVLAMSQDGMTDRVRYRLRGRLGGRGLVGATFDTTGELLLPESGGAR